MSKEGKVVCVTGASGFIASWIVKLLLARGYTVHATVRSLADSKKTEHLLALDGAKERLSLYEATLTVEMFFRLVAQLLDPAVKGALNVLKSASKVPSLKRVVFTSSIAAVAFGAKAPVFGDMVDETWCKDGKSLEPLIYNVSRVKVESLGVEFTPVEGRFRVTYASELIASWLVKLFPVRGYTDHATVSSLSDTLMAVYHTASPVQFIVDDPQAQLIDPAVKGALNVLKSASKEASIKRVVFTSSIATVMFGAKVPVFGDMVDETWFSDPLLWYHASKTMAENAAVKFSQENGMDLVSINPGFVIGPILQPTLNLTSEGFMNLIECGKEVFPDGVYRLVDVRDVAIAHILAFENPKANGRYCVVGNVIQSSEIMKIVDKFYPSLDHSKRCKDGKSLEPLIYNVSRVKVESLGVEFTPVEHQTMSGEGKVVCVTGASGFIASWIVKLLLHRGYSVHATVRSLGDPKKTEHLLALDGAKERLSLYEANLIEDGSFDSAVEGCVCVFHTASPVQLIVDDPQAQLMDPAVKGTLNVLKSASKVPSLKRVVLTSSMATVSYGSKVPVFGDVVDETWSSDPIYCQKIKLWYVVSKIMAEDAAVKFSQGNGMDLVSINPGYVIGPILQPTLNVTSEGFMNLIKTGKDVFPDKVYILADVRDVALAHILAFENPEANGRYCVVESVIHSSQILKIVEKLYPTLDHSEKYKDSKGVESLIYSVSRVKTEGLGVEFTPLEVSIKDTIESLKEKNWLSF
ncbi:cinnamoyl-CoA reductase 1-like protein isoform X2 [Tanacetum coccineum]